MDKKNNVYTINDVEDTDDEIAYIWLNISEEVNKK